VLSPVPGVRLRGVNSTNVRSVLRRRSFLLLILPVLLVAVPQVQADRAPASAEIEAATVAVPLTLTPQMRLWVHDAVPVEGTIESRLRRLSRALLDTNEFQLTENPDYTGTASEVFRSRRANCVGYSMLFVGLAREIGISTYFITFDRARQVSKRGNLSVAADHMAAAYGEGDRLLVFDLAGVARTTARKVRRLGDPAASAIFYSNAGVELLLGDKARAAVDHLEIAVWLDPTMADGWSNLGVAFRRTGSRHEAREAYRRALELNPGSETTRTNLMVLQGRPD